MVSNLLTEIQGAENYSQRDSTVRELCDQFNIDTAHAQRVAANAIMILNELHQFQPMPLELAPLLETSALLHDIGSNVEVDRHHIYGRDLILKHKLDGYDQTEQSILAFLISLHRKNIKHKKLEKQLQKTNLPPDTKNSALQLAAILRVADGLDHTHSQTTQITALHHQDHSFLLELTGEQSKKDGRRALQKSDLWTYIFKRPLNCVLGEKNTLLPGPRWSGLTIPTQSLTSIEIDRNDRVVDAARIVLTFHFIRMLQHEPGALIGEDIEAVHDMRVAIRRMRTGTKILRSYLPKEHISNLRRGLKTTAKVLGEVRDLDVFKYNFDRYVREQSSWREEAFEPLLDHWQQMHTTAHEALIEYLDGKDYKRFVGDFENFIAKFGKYTRAIPPERSEARVYQIVPSITYKLDRNVRLFNNRLPDSSLDELHQLRIDLKRFRYTLEFFESALGESTEVIIDEVTTLQDHLGDIQDAYSALKMVSSRIEHKDRDRIHNRASAQYVENLEERIKDLTDGFPAAWQHFQRPEIRKLLAEAVGIL